MGYFIGWSTFKNFIKRWKNKSLIYLAISDNILIYQDFDIMGKLKKIEIPLKDIQNIQFITVPGSAENPDAYYVRLYYKDNNQQKYLDIDYFFGSSFLPKGINLLNILQQEIKQ
ncbi:MAG: hypothetical protein HPY79_09680 [Bacteroidales bacterium]|nr:hypothetical protein [Bacteroidales bacterium]